MSKVAICIDVPDMGKGIRFYTKALSCELVKEGKEYSELSLDEIRIHLIERATGTNPLVAGEAARNYDRHWTPVHLDFSVSNVDECVSLITEFGGVKEGEASGDWGSVAFCADPFGNGFCVMCHNT